MKEAVIRKKAQEILRAEGYVICTPKRSRFGTSITETQSKRIGSDDIFSIFDLVAWKDGTMKFVQYTTKGHINDRVKKIKDFLKDNQLSIPEGIFMEVWGLEKDFTIHRIRQNFYAESV